MEADQSILSKLIQGIKGPRGGRYLLLGGVLITVLSCVSTVFFIMLSPSTEKGTTSPPFVAFLGLLSLLMVGIGVIITIIGGVVSLLQNQKAKRLNTESTPTTIVSESLNQVEPESNKIEALPVQSSLPETKTNESIPLESLPVQPLSIQPASDSLNQIEPESNKIQTLPFQSSSTEVKTNESISPKPLPIQPPSNQPVYAMPHVQAVFTQPAPNRGLPIERRREILQREINKYLRQGYRVISQTDITAQLVKPKTFSCFWALVFTLTLIGLIFYLIWYWSKRDSQIYIEVDINGAVKIRR